MYAYAFVILNQQVGVFKRTQKGGLIFVCMQEAGADFFDNFNEIYNIEPHRPKDFCFVWEEGCTSALLQHPYFKRQLRESVWGADLLCDLLSLLYTQHGLKGCLQDFNGQRLEGGDVMLYTNTDLSPKENPSPSVAHHSDQSEWQQEEWQKTQRFEEARGKKRQKPQTPKPTACKLPSQGGDEPPTTQETNH
ncbi:hypothetical protein NHP190003_14680 [Helicobacter sp. NHP19-003]|uniref:Uncharacterized protein n=1 Tax=Helicobacter gastrocanis TaxID=2849641 RepID=A0ABN6I3Q6_9HELI|nr:hypothetical protein [Helicobacter sp. NHP19-003]BCZ18186.1 hypothetical protein NHP190003_14680 [Helicobacter sp. NHP19-003]